MEQNPHPIKRYVYTDGAAVPNPGIGAWAFVVLDEESNLLHKDSAQAPGTSTNNQMEMMAAIKALEYLSLNGKMNIIILTDSQYLAKGGNSWIHKWKKNNWKTSEGGPVKNGDLWRRIDQLATNHSLHFVWIEGHSGDVWNEMCDQMCSVHVPSPEYRMMPKAKGRRKRR